MTLNATGLPSFLQEQLSHIDDEQRIAFIVPTAVWLPLAWIAVCLRFISRHYSAMRYGWDDWTIIVALILSTAWTIDACIGVLFGAGRHWVFLVLNPAVMDSYLKLTLTTDLLYHPVLFVIKLSILLLYGRIFTNRMFHIGLWIVGAFTAAYTICAVVVVGVDVNHNIIMALTIFGILNIITDLVILVMPISMVWNLHVNRITRIQVIALFLTGGLVTIFSIVRVVYTALIDIEDASWTGSKAEIWSIAETSIAIISACLPTYRPLFDKSKRKSSHQYLWSRKQATYIETGSGVIEQPLHEIHVQTSITNTWTDRDENSSTNTLPQ